jgi:hypothetical protein
MATSTTRRERQIVEIALLLAAGKVDRASGLTLVHVADFPDDAELLTQMTTSASDP